MSLASWKNANVNAPAPKPAPKPEAEAEEERKETERKETEPAEPDEHIRVRGKHKTRAKLGSIENGITLLKMPTGETVEVPHEKLSPVEQQCPYNPP